MLHRKPPKAQVVYLPRYILVQSIFLNSHLVENCNGADGHIVISKNNLMPRDKIQVGFMYRHNLVFMHS